MRYIGISAEGVSAPAACGEPSKRLVTNFPLRPETAAGAHSEYRIARALTSRRFCSSGAFLDSQADLARNMLKSHQARDFVGFPTLDQERIVPLLQEIRAVVTLAPAKPSGLADLGVPLVDTTVVKKGRVHEFAQVLQDGKVGRRFQDLRVIGIKTVEAGVPSAKLFVQFEVFGDNTVAPAIGAGFNAALSAGSEPLASLSSSSLFLPYGNFWYPNRFVFEVPIADFDRADNFIFIANPEEVRSI